ncbi:hypothetical protein UF75_2890 [Desulfosporosinus sp. I2]|nr:hypothetical protein UF75_2890 [Desulfosporosinus sp. I2]
MLALLLLIFNTPPCEGNFLSMRASKMILLLRGGCPVGQLLVCFEPQK